MIILFIWFKRIGASFVKVADKKNYPTVKHCLIMKMHEKYEEKFLGKCLLLASVTIGISFGSQKVACFYRKSLHLANARVDSF